MPNFKSLLESKELQEACALFDGIAPPKHSVIQEEIILKYKKFFTENECARIIILSLVSFSGLHYAIERGDVSSRGAEHYYNCLFLKDGGLNPNLPMNLEKRAWALKEWFDNVLMKQLKEKENAFNEMSVELGADIERFEDLFADINKRLGDRGLVYLPNEETGEAPSTHYILQDIKTKEKRVFAFG